jgi:ERF superfamily
MHRSSETIGAIASALAKAQGEIVNPEKSLVGTIRATHARENDRTFRYAALSSGLDIVRKSLGGHEIATVQTTAIDNEAGMLRLTTVLAHSSGEWLSSEWPVCALSETATPRRMGAALTYARRYALFTLVGIAGEDDLDAPDLGDSGPKTVPDQPKPDPDKRLNGQTVATEVPSHWGSRRRTSPIYAAKPILPPDQSAVLRDRLIAELSTLHSHDEATAWAQKSMPAKNSLIMADAALVMADFEAKLASVGDDLPEAGQGGVGRRPRRRARQADPNGKETAQPSAEEPLTERPGLAPKTIRLRDKEHRKFISRQPCLVCGRTPADPHHLRFAQPRALGRKVSDEFTVPVCRVHHNELHRYGDEVSWWAGVNVDPVPIALGLWRRTRSEGALSMKDDDIDREVSVGTLKHPSNKLIF